MKKIERSLKQLFTISMIGLGLAIADAVLFGINDPKDWFFLIFNAVGAGLWGWCLLSPKNNG